MDSIFLLAVTLKMYRAFDLVGVDFKVKPDLCHQKSYLVLDCLG